MYGIHAKSHYFQHKTPGHFRHLSLNYRENSAKRAKYNLEFIALQLNVIACLCVHALCQEIVTT